MPDLSPQPLPPAPVPSGGSVSRLPLGLRRAIAAGLDLVLVVASAAGPYALGRWAAGIEGQPLVPPNGVVRVVDGVIARALDRPPRPEGSPLPPLTNLLWSVGAIAPLGVLAWQWQGLARRGQTAAKASLGLQVVAASTGAVPGWGRILRREALGRWALPLGLAWGLWRWGGAVPDLGILLGLAGLLVSSESLAALGHPARRSLHDRLGETRVIDPHDPAEQATPPPPVARQNPRRPGASTDALWYWMRSHPGASLVTAATLGTLLILATFIATQLYAQQQQSERSRRAQDRELLLGLVGKYSQNAPDERRGSILALASLNDPQPEILLLANLLGQEEEPKLIEALQQALTSAGPAALPYLARLNQTLRADLEGAAGNPQPAERDRAARRLQATQRAIAKLLSLRNGTSSPVDLQRVHLGQSLAAIAPFQLVLQRADLSGLDARGAILTGATLLGSQFRSAGPDGRTGSFDDAIAALGGAQLGGADLSYADLTGVDLSQAGLERAALSYATLNEAHLDLANLSGAKLVRTKLVGAFLSGASLTAADLTEADLRRATLTSAKLGQARAAGALVERADLREASLRGADFSAASLAWSDLSRADLAAAKLLNTNLRGASLEGANLQGADLSRADLRQTKLDGANFKAVVFLPGATPPGESLVNRPTPGAATGAIVQGSDFSLVKNLDRRQLAYLCASGALHPQCSQ